MNRPGVIVTTYVFANIDGAGTTFTPNTRFFPSLASSFFSGRQKRVLEPSASIVTPSLHHFECAVRSSIARLRLSGSENENSTGCTRSFLSNLNELSFTIGHFTAGSTTGSVFFAPFSWMNTSSPVRFSSQKSQYTWMLIVPFMSAIAL